jgi:uncharacterized protein (DUF1330 family)
MAKKGYWIASVEVSDNERYKDYVTAATPAYQRFGAKFLVRGGEHVAPEGDWHSRNVVIEFPTYQDAHDCYQSPEYAKARAIRQEVSEGRILIVEGYE